MNNAVPDISEEMDRLYDVDAVISGAIALVDKDSLEGNEIFRLLSVAQKTLCAAINNLDLATTAK